MNKLPKLAASSLLNKVGFQSVAAISYLCYPTTYSKIHKYDDNIMLNISDCTRAIELNMNIDTEDEYKNSLYKCRKLKEIVSKLEKDLKIAYEYNQSVKDEK